MSLLFKQKLLTAGNINYQKANDFLDLRNVNEARKKWKKSREYYESSLQIDNNDKARQFIFFKQTN